MSSFKYKNYLFLVCMATVICIIAWKLVNLKVEKLPGFPKKNDILQSKIEDAKASLGNTSDVAGPEKVETGFLDTREDREKIKTKIDQSNRFINRADGMEFFQKQLVDSNENYQIALSISKSKYEMLSKNFIERKILAVN